MKNTKQKNTNQSDKKGKNVTVFSKLAAALAVVASIIAILVYFGIEPNKMYQNKAEQLNNKGYDCWVNSDYEKAIEYYDRAITLESHGIDNIEVWFFNRGKAYYDLGNYEKAIEDFTQAIAYTPKRKYYAERGLAYEKMGEVEKATEDAMLAAMANE